MLTGKRGQSDGQLRFRPRLSISAGLGRLAGEAGRRGRGCDRAGCVQQCPTCNPRRPQGRLSARVSVSLTKFEPKEDCAAGFSDTTPFGMRKQTSGSSRGIPRSCMFIWLRSKELVVLERVVFVLWPRAHRVLGCGISSLRNARSRRGDTNS